jgi:predicted MFS family arabinose efflux permease
MGSRMDHKHLPTAMRQLAWSSLAAHCADQLALVAIPIFAVVVLGAGPGETGFLVAAQTLPFLLLTLPVGVLVDRLVQRRLLMATAESVRAIVLAILPALVAFGWFGVPSLALAGFLAAAGTVVYTVAAPALVAALVPPEAFAVANGRLELARNTAFAVGAALAGALVSMIGASLTFMLAAALSAIAASFLANLSEPRFSTSGRRNVRQELYEGASFIWRHDLLRPILLTAVVWNLSWSVLLAVYAPYAIKMLGLSATGVGITLGAYGAGSVVGAVLASRIANALSFGATLALGPLLSAIGAGAMTASIWLPTGILPGTAFFLLGFGPTVWTIGQTTLRQTVTPHVLLGRVSAVVMTSTAGVRPFGAILSGLVGGAFGSEACLVLAALGFAIQGIIIYLSPVPYLAVLPQCHPPAL